MKKSVQGFVKNTPKFPQDVIQIDVWHGKMGAAGDMYSLEYDCSRYVEY